MKTFLYDRYASTGDEFYSDAIDAVAYNREDSQLYVEFQSGGEYVYEGVSESTYNLFVTADSLGRFWRDYISGQYDSHKDYYLLDPNEGYDEEANDASTPSIEELGGVSFDTIFGTDKTKSKYGVKWQTGAVTAEPVFSAYSEDDALGLFRDAIENAGVFNDVKVLAVTHYFE